MEGNDDKYAIASLMGFHTAWPDKKEDAPVHITVGNGADEILASTRLNVTLKTPGLKTLGVVLDADQSPAASRYMQVRNQLIHLFPRLPELLPSTGLIIENDDRLRFGLWIMPDNTSLGDLEMFLKELAPKESELTWRHAVDSVEAARNKGCPCRETHVAKANLYTWLAWQDPPGQSPGIALTKKILDPLANRAEAFVKWFMDLYDLSQLEQPSLILTPA